MGHHDQVLVEATAIAVGLHWSRRWLWDTLPESTHESLIAWLSGARDAWCADNNHVLLGATVQAFLASVGADHDQEEIDGALNRIDDWYAGDGWYSDGVGRRFDHYNAYTFHLYPFLIEQMLSHRDPAVRGVTPTFEVRRSRLRLFLDDYQHLFDATGAPVLQGRSLIYRWGMLAPFWMGQLQGVSPLSPGRTRRLASGMLAGFVDAGALDSGVLDLGWKRPAPDLLQSYNVPGSPLWASKGFLGLLLPPGHPVWQDVEEPLALEDGDVLRPMAGPGWLAVGQRGDGVVRLLNYGSDGHPRRDDPLYRRQAFSSATVPVQVAGLADNTIAVGPREAHSVHRGLVAGTVRRSGGASSWRADAQGRDVAIDAATLSLGATEIRLARLIGALDQPVRCSGWAVCDDAPTATDGSSTWSSATTSHGQTSAIALITSSGPISTTTSCAHVESRPHQSALGEHVGLPWIEVDAGTEGTVALAWLVRLGSHWDPSTLDRVTVTWCADGAFVEVDGERHHCAWTRERPWRGDDTNQGIFRVGSVAAQRR